MRGAPHSHPPAVAFHDIAGLDLADAWCGALSGHTATARAKDVDAALVLDARADVGAIDAILAEQLPGHALDRGRAIHLQVGDPVRTLVPPLQHEAPVIHA